MYVTDIIWWGYSAYVLGLAIFMLVFAVKVRQKGG